MSTVVEPQQKRDLKAVADQIARDVVAPAAGSVDRGARFPAEAVAAMREARLLSAMIPTEMGGGGASLLEVAAVVETLGRACASTSMLYAMHQIQVACLVRHHGDSPWLLDYIRKVADGELLLASATSEAGVGGDVRNSLCSLDWEGDRFRLVKQASVISYGEAADGVLATTRRDPDSASSDQVLVVVPITEGVLEMRGTWDTLGFRGTCSLGFVLSASGDAGQVLPMPYAEISAQTMLPVSHVLWTHVWLGIAAGSVARARALLRAEARKNPGQDPPKSRRLAETVAVLQQFRELVDGSAKHYASIMDDEDALNSMAFAIRMNNLKVSGSQAVVDVVSRAMFVCGMAGYREDSPYSLGRSLRDAYGAALMINNDRIFEANARLLLVSKDD